MLNFGCPYWEKFRKKTLKQLESWLVFYSCQQHPSAAQLQHGMYRQYQSHDPELRFTDRL